MKLKLFVLLAFAVSCTPEKKVEYATVVIKRGVIKNSIALVGRTEAAQQTSISAPDDLSVLNLLVNNGQLVKEGELLCELDPTKALEDVTLEEQKFAQMESQLKAATIRIEGLKKDIEKTKKLFGSGAVSLDEKQKQEQEFKIQETQFESMLEDRKNAQAHLERQKKKAELLGIKAPFLGVVSYIWITKDSFIPGSSVKKGDVLFKLSSQGKMLVKSTLREQDISYFAKGQKLTLNFPSLKNSTAEGVVVHVDNVANIDKESGVSSFKIQIEFTPPENVKSGMEAEIDFLITKKEGALLVPKSALRLSGGETAQVALISKDVKIKRKIKVGISDETNVEILEGLNAGENVLVNYEE